MEQKTLNLAFTGHRPGKYFGYGYDDAHRARIRSLIYSWFYQWVRQGHKVRTITGGALGFDQDVLATALVLDVIHNTVAVPFEGQENRWNEVDQRRYRSLLFYANEVVAVSPPGYAAWKMHKRNEWMVDRANSVVALWDGGESGGTAACVRYARKVEKPLVVINPTTLEWSVEGKV